MSTSTNLLQTAFELSSFGLNPMPCLGKYPKGVSWRKYQARQSSAEEIKNMFFNHPTHPQIGIVCGTGSGDLEVIDFDKKHYKPGQDVYEEWAEIIKNQNEDLFHKLVIELTPTGGFHVYYRCEDLEGSQKLATWYNGMQEVPVMVDDKPTGETTLAPDYRSSIETRGRGGFIICDPSPGYSLIQHDLFSIPNISPYERDLLISAARSFNDMPEEKEDAAIVKRNGSFKWNGINPFDDYNEKGNPIELMQNHGWSIVDNHSSKERIYLLRPGEVTSKHSANYHIAKKRLRVYSTATVFANDHANKKRGQKGIAYDPAGIYAVLEHGGNKKKAFWALLDLGYGTKGAGDTNKRYINQEDDESVEDPPVKGKKSKKKKGITIAAVEDLLSEKYHLIKNAVTQRIELRFVEEDDSKLRRSNIHSLFREIQHANINFSIEKLKSLLQSDFVDEYDPFKKFFEGLPKPEIDKYGDIVDSQIDKLSSYITIKDMGDGIDMQQHWKSMYRKFLVRSIACSTDGIVNRFIMTLITEKQNTGKSTFIRFHSPFPNRQYYCESPIRTDKDTQFRFAENFIYNIEELAGLDKDGVENLKAIISAYMIKERKAYAVDDVEMWRRTNFWGSTNRIEFLIDSENTRWLCFVIDKIDWNYSKEIDILRVWAEAYYLYKREGVAPYELTLEEQFRNNKINKNFMMGYGEDNTLAKFFSPAAPHSAGAAFLSSTDIIARARHLDKNIPPMHATTMGRALAKAGYVRSRYKERPGYWCIENKNVKTSVDENAAPDHSENSGSFIPPISRISTSPEKHDDEKPELPF